MSGVRGCFLTEDLTNCKKDWAGIWGKNADFFVVVCPGAEHTSSGCLRLFHLLNSLPLDVC